MDLFEHSHRKTPLDCSIESPSYLFYPYEFIVHALNFGPRDKGFVRPEASSKGMGDMEDLMDQHLGLVFFVQWIKPFGEDFNNIMRFLVKGQLQDA
jgi:hypothetical protein